MLVGHNNWNFIALSATQRFNKNVEQESIASGSTNQLSSVEPTMFHYLGSIKWKMFHNILCSSRRAFIKTEFSSEIVLRKYFKRISIKAFYGAQHQPPTTVAVCFNMRAQFA